MNKIILVIGLTGQINSGKDTLGDAIATVARENGFTVLRRGFGDALKEEVANALDRWTWPQWLEAFRLGHGNQKLLRQILNDTFMIGTGSLDNCLGLIPTRDYRGAGPECLAAMHDRDKKEQFRALMQWWGTEYRRACFSQNYWLEQIGLYIDQETAALPDGGKLLLFIPDVRFPNELSYVQDQLTGYCIRIERPSTDVYGDHAHPSETALLEFVDQFNMTIINDSTLEKFVANGTLAFGAAMSWRFGGS